MFRTINLRRFAAPVVDLLRAGSISLRSPEDTIAVLANSGFRPDDVGVVSQYLNQRLFGMTSHHALQILLMLDRYRNEGSDEFFQRINVEQLRDALFADPVTSNISVSELIRGLEILEQLLGPDWDMRIIYEKCRPLTRWISSNICVHDLVRLGKMGFTDEAFVGPSIGRILSQPVSVLLKSKIAFYFGGTNLEGIRSLLSSNSTLPSISCLPYMLGACTAWGVQKAPLEENLSEILSTSSIQGMSPNTAQLLLWIATAQNLYPSCWESLLAVAGRSPWQVSYMREQTHMAMNETYEPPYPIRYPHKGSSGVSDFLKRLTEAILAKSPGNIPPKRHVSIGARYWADMVVDKQKIVIVEPENADPMFNIYLRHLERSLPGTVNVKISDSLDTVLFKLE